MLFITGVYIKILKNLLQHYFTFKLNVEGINIGRYHRTRVLNSELTYD